MKDVKLVWDRFLQYADMSIVTDYALEVGSSPMPQGDLMAEEGLETAVMLSVFTDRRARDDDTLPDLSSKDKRGWWGDLVSPTVEGDRIGSRLWLLERSKVTQQVLNQAKSHIEESLQWVIDDEVAARVDVEVEEQGEPYNKRLAFRVTMYYQDVGRGKISEYQTQWEAMF